MLVLLNGGGAGHDQGRAAGVPLADACVTEWRWLHKVDESLAAVPLADACVTEWR